MEEVFLLLKKYQATSNLHELACANMLLFIIERRKIKMPLIHRRCIIECGECGKGARETI